MYLCWRHLGVTLESASIPQDDIGFVGRNAGGGCESLGFAKGNGMIAPGYRVAGSVDRGLLNLDKCLRQPSPLMYAPSFVSADFCEKRAPIVSHSERLEGAMQNDGNRLADPGIVFRVRAGYRRGAERLDENEHGLFPCRACYSRMGCRARVHVREPRRAGSYRHGRFRSEVRNRHLALLLDRRNSRDGLRRYLHDAVLLRLPRALGA